MIRNLNKKGFTLIELIIVVAIMAVLVSMLAPNVIKYLEQSKVGKDVSTLDNVRTAIEAEITDERLSTLNTDEENTEDDIFTGMNLEDIYNARTNPSDGEWGTLGYRLFGDDKVLADVFKSDKIFASKAGQGGKIRVYINGSGGVAAVGVDADSKIIKDSERGYLIATKLSDEESAKLDCY